MAMIFMPIPQQPQRREIVKDGIIYREVLPGDDASGWQLLVGSVGLLLIGVPILFALMVWTLVPIMGWIIDHGPKI